MKKQKNKKAWIVSFIIHSGVILAGIFPLISMVHKTTEVGPELHSIIAIEFESGEMSPSSASTRVQAGQEVKLVEAVEEGRTESEAVQPALPSEKNSKVAERPDAEIVMEKGTLDDSVTDNSLGDPAEADEEEAIGGAKGGLDSDAGEGETGIAITGEALAHMDFEGEGVFGRRIIYHANISRLAEKEGRVVVNLCINRSGKVTHVAFNKADSSLTDTEYVTRVMQVASRYRFEADYEAPQYQCGKLTFIFQFNS